MSQTFVTIASGDTLSNSRTDINNNFDALKTTFIGSSDPGSPATGLIWVNSTTNKLKARINGSTTVDLGDWAAQMGHLRSDGTIALSGNMSAGSNKITNLAAGTASSNDAARMVDLDSKLSKTANDTFAAGIIPKVDSGISAGSFTDSKHLVSREYADTKIDRSGDTGITGRFAYTVAVGGYDPSDNSTSLLHLLKRQEVEDLLSFNVTGGHNHNGSNSRRVKYNNIDTSDITGATPVAAGQIMVADGSSNLAAADPPKCTLGDAPGTQYFSKTSSDGGFTTYTANDVPNSSSNNSKILILYFGGTFDITTGVSIDVRRPGGGAAATYSILNPGTQLMVPLDTNRQFAAKLTIIGSGTVTAKYIGYITTS